MTASNNTPDSPLSAELIADSVALGGRASDGSDHAVDGRSEPREMPLLDAVRSHPEISGLIEMSDEFLASQGFTEHGYRHANLVGHISYNVLSYLGFEPRLAELGAVAGYLHDIGNVVSRSQHGQSSGLIAFTVLRELDVPIRDIAQIMGAVGNHEEQYGVAVSPVSAAVIVADKSDVHRSRVRESGDIEGDIHDRVNFAVTSSFLRVSEGVDPSDTAADLARLAELGVPTQQIENVAAASAIEQRQPDTGLAPTGRQIIVPTKTLTLELEVDTTVTPVFEYFEIFMERMVMCRRAGRTLGAEFKITVNDVPVL